MRSASLLLLQSGAIPHLAHRRLPSLSISAPGSNRAKPRFGILDFSGVDLIALNRLMSPIYVFPALFRGYVQAKLMILGLLPALLIAASGSCHADSVLRNLEITQCEAGDIVTWGDGQDRALAVDTLTFHYAHVGAPLWFEQQQVLDLLKKVTTEWSRCGIPAKAGLVDAATRPSGKDIIIRWDTANNAGHFGLSDISRHQLLLGAEAFRLLNQRNPTNDSFSTLQMVLSHEIGHFYGLMDHSRRCIDTLSYYHDGKGGQCRTRHPEAFKRFKEYRSSLPTACDIQRCRILNGKR